jgi:hypothetical protein
LEKFTKLAHQLDNEFEELLFTMKNAHTIDLENRANVPAFWKKSWYKNTIKELNLSKMSAENRLIYELTQARAAATAAQEEADLKKRDAERDAERDALQKTATIEKLLALEVDIDKIAKATDTSIDFVLDIKSKMNLSSL